MKRWKVRGQDRPVAAFPNLVIGVEIWVALYDYDHFDTNAKEFLSFQEGDIFHVLPSNNDLQGWKIAINAQGQKGFVPGNYLQLQSEMND